MPLPSVSKTPFSLPRPPHPPSVLPSSQARSNTPLPFSLYPTPPPPLLHTSMDSSTSRTSSGVEPGSQTTVTLSRKQRIARKKTSDMDNAGQESLAIIRRARLPEGQRRTRRRRNNVKNMMKEDSTSGCNVNVCEEDEKAEVESKIVALQRIVPGGESLGIDKLFEETAGYILELQFQVKALKFLANFVEGSEKEKRKLGG